MNPGGYPRLNERMKTLRACTLLMLTAIIWGFAMAAQQKISQVLGPFTCNAMRFLIAAATLFPFMVLQNKKNRTPVGKTDLLSGLTVGIVIFAAAFCQQAGVGETGAGKAGFITALYVVLVPLVGGLLFRHKTPLSTWLSLLIALPGLYLLCIPRGESFTLSRGDLWMLTGALFWALHILTTDLFVSRTTALKLCVIQFIVSAVLNFLCALIFEEISLPDIGKVILPLLYCGMASNGLGYLFQTLGQRHAKPAHAALILSLECVFCLVAGALLLQERMSLEGYIGSAMMLTAVLLSQLGMLKNAPPAERS